jgi:hypothetical protein
MVKKIVQTITLGLGILLCTLIGTYAGLKVHDHLVKEKTVLRQAKEAGLAAQKAEKLKKIVTDFRTGVRIKCVETLNKRFNVSWRLYDISCDLRDPEDLYRMHGASIRFHFHDDIRCLCRASMLGSSVLLETHMWY